ncbi:MAG TPA: ABC transporter permease [Terriglobales bacterium]|nr:ABC transporter permease [Terriglobales bacterium]
MKNPFQGVGAIFYKEVRHMRRDPMAFLFAFVMPVIQLVILGAAIDTNIRQVRTAVYDASGSSMITPVSGSSESRAFIDRLRNSDMFYVYKYVHSDAELNEEMVSGRASVGVKIPVDFDRNLLKGNQAQILVMVDGSDANVAGQTVNVSGSLGLDESLRRMLTPGQKNPIEIRPQVMFNPASRSPNFLLPGMMAILLILVTVMLTAFSIVREKERGTIEQLFVTPVRPMGLMLGKILPYFVTGIVELSILLIFMRFVFQIPMHGNVLVLGMLTTGYLFVNLAIGILISSKANSQAEALQFCMVVMLLSIFLSGFMFPRETMPVWAFTLSHFVPATYMIKITRGVILRGAGLEQLWLNGVILFAMGVGLLLVAAKRFRGMTV